jgi:hypothetical protein
MKKIKKTEWYTPKEIVENGFIDSITKATSKENKLQMMLRFIRTKRIEAKNVGTKQKHRYIILGEHLTKFINTK